MEENAGLVRLKISRVQIQIPVCDRALGKRNCYFKEHGLCNIVGLGVRLS